MRITIENLGPVTKGEFDLRPLTIFIGDNRQGKTQTLYTATAFLDIFGILAYTNNYAQNPALHFPELDQIYPALIKNGNTSINLINFFQNNYQKYLDNLTALAPKLIGEILGSAKENYTDTKLHFTLTKNEQDKLLTLIKEFSAVTEISGLGLKYIKETDKPDLIIYKTETFNEKIPANEIIIKILISIFSLFQLLLYREFIYFPAERSAISVFLRMFNNINQKKTTGETLILPRQMEISEILNGCAYPAKQYLHLIYTLLYDSDIEVIRRDLQNVSKEDILLYQNLADLLTDKIIKDIITLRKTETGYRKEIIVEANGKELDLPLASSGVKGFMGLVLYLRYLTTRGNTLVIDEPEENLHPTQQAAFAEFITILVNNGINVALTTHSPYLIEHLQSLIIASDLKNRSEIIPKLILKREDAFIAKEKTAVYLFENNTIKDILLQDGEINWQTFCDTSNLIDDIDLITHYQKDKEKENDEIIQNVQTGIVAESQIPYQK